MQNEIKLTQSRFKRLLIVILCVSLFGGWFQMSDKVSATSAVFPETNEDGIYDSGAEEVEEVPSTVKPQQKPIGHVSVSMEDYIYGGTVPALQVVTYTGDVNTVKIEYKVTGAEDSTYSAAKPTEVGNYTVRATVPENEKFSQYSATDTFSIRYLPTPVPAYELDGISGENGWYKSEIVVKPPAGYEMSVGNRSDFSSKGYTVENETAALRIYLKKIATGEMTDVIVIANLRIDADAPELTEMQDGEEYYEDVIKVDFTDKHIKTAIVNGETVEITTDETGEHSLAVETGMRRMSYVIVLKDEAGNETKVSMILGPAWLKDGIVGEGDYYLETGEEYHFPEGSEWVKSGDNTVYSGGASFYANSEGEVTFSKE